MRTKSEVYTFLTKKQNNRCKECTAKMCVPSEKSLEDRNNAQVDGDALNESMDE